MKTYWTEEVAATFWNCDRKTHRKWINKLLDFFANNFTTVLIVLILFMKKIELNYCADIFE
jgi:hypothetical protein